MRRTLTLPAVSVVFAGLFLSGCNTSSSSPSVLKVSASFYPIAEVVRNVGGDLVDVQDLTPSGHDAHDTELTAKQLQRLEESSRVFYFGDNFQPGAQKAIEELPTSRRIDLFEPVEGKIGQQFLVKRNGVGPTCGGCEVTTDFDPHVWLDPANMILLTHIVEDQLAQLAPKNAQIFASNAQTYSAKLSSVGTLIDTTFTKCESSTLATAHNSFGYFARRAHLITWPLAGYSPDQLASAKALNSIVNSLKEFKVTTVFDEPGISTDLVKQVASKLNGTVDHLNAVETITPTQLDDGIGYVDIMKENIMKIAKALRCS